MVAMKNAPLFERENGGLITEKDLAAYQVKERTPLVGVYRGYEVLTAPPPSSGGAVLLEILNILSGYDLAKLGPDNIAGERPICFDNTSDRVISTACFRNARTSGSSCSTPS